MCKVEEVWGMSNPQMRWKLWLHDGRRETEKNKFWRNNDKIFIAKTFSSCCCLMVLCSAFFLAFISHNNLLLLLLHYLNENFMANFTFEVVICNTKSSVFAVACADAYPGKGGLEVKPAPLTECFFKLLGFFEKKIH